MTPETLNLQELAIERRPTPAKQVVGRRRFLSARSLLPVVVIVGFVAVIFGSSLDSLLPRHDVTVVPVIVSRADVQQEGTELFQAPGWIEPRPTAINVAALTQGVIGELLVVEGQDVIRGQPVAKLIDIDARLAVQQAKAVCELREAELRSAQASLKAAELRRDHPVHLQAALADAQSSLAQIKTQLAQIPFLVESAQARVAYAQQNLDGKTSAGIAIPQRLIQEAKSDHATAHADLNELTARPDLLKSQELALNGKVEALSTQLKLLIEESRQVEEAQAACQAAQARLDEANVMHDLTKLALERTTVSAPVDGRVLRLLAYPGTRVMGMEATSGQSSSTVVELYQPKSLQLRADVRLEDLPLVLPGQKVRIVTASSKTPLHGTVLLPTSTANIQKNTLEVKIAIDDPPTAIRPEMLVSATFLAPPQIDGGDASRQSERLLVPRELVESGESGSHIWIVDPEGRAQKRPVTMGKAGTDKLVEVAAGLHPTDRLIAAGRQGISQGARLRVTGEDTTLGMNEKE